MSYAERMRALEQPAQPEVQRRRRGSYPRAIRHEPGPEGYMRTTFSLPNGRRMTVTVPVGVWLEGHHMTIGAQPHAWLDAV